MKKYIYFQKLTEDALPFSGKIDLKNPDQLYYLLEDYGKQSKNAESVPQHVYFGRWVSVLLKNLLFISFMIHVHVHVYCLNGFL